MNTKRDKFLTEAMGECWHDMTGPFITPDKCSKCENNFYILQNNFSAWEGFGKLWKWAQKQEWWEEFTEDNYNRLFAAKWSHEVLPIIINPDRFANAIFTFLKERTLI